MGEKISRRGADAQRGHCRFVFSAPLRLCVSTGLFAIWVTCGQPACSRNAVSSKPQDLEVKASVFVFTLTDCPICNAYAPELNRLYDEFFKRGVNMVMVPVDTDITFERFIAHREKYDIRMPFVLDPNGDWIERAGATTAPEAALFSPSGELLYRGRIDDQYAGLGKRRTVVTSHDLRDALEAILAGKPVREPRTEAVGCPIPK